MRKVIYAGGVLALVTAIVLVYEARAGAQNQDRLRIQVPPLSLIGPGSSIGISVRDADAGVVIQEVRGDTPASRAGLKEGDIVTQFDGERTRSAAQFTRLVRETAPGRTVKITFLRDGKSSTLDITPDARGADDLRFPNLTRDFERGFNVLPRDFAFNYDFSQSFGYSPRRLGVTVQGMTDQLAGYFGVTQGVLVSNVVEGSPAQAAGIKAGDVILSIRGHSVSDAGDVTRELRDAEAGSSVELRIMRDRKEVTLTAKMPERTRPVASGGRPV